MSAKTTVWRMTLEAPANGILFDAAGGPLDLAGEGLPGDLIRQIETLQADSRAFWRGAVQIMAKTPRREVVEILESAGADAVLEAAEALIVALGLARPEVQLDIDIDLMP